MLFYTKNLYILIHTYTNSSSDILSSPLLAGTVPNTNCKLQDEGNKTGSSCSGFCACIHKMSQDKAMTKLDTSLYTFGLSGRWDHTHVLLARREWRKKLFEEMESQCLIPDAVTCREVFLTVSGQNLWVGIKDSGWFSQGSIFKILTYRWRHLTQTHPEWDVQVFWWILVKGSKFSVWDLKLYSNTPNL